MSYQDHFKTCRYCNKGLLSKPTITVKSASSGDKRRKLAELGAMIKGVKLESSSFQTKTKGASVAKNNFSQPGPIERAIKLKELSKMIRG
jgi:hypothetical protein